MYQGAASQPSVGARESSVWNGYRNAPAPASATNATSSSVPPAAPSRPAVRRPESAHAAGRTSTGGPASVSATPNSSAGRSELRVAVSIRSVALRHGLLQRLGTGVGPAGRRRDDRPRLHRLGAVIVPVPAGD